MEPVTHILTGACLSRTGLNRYAAYATMTMMVAAEFPDIDMLWGLRGPVEQLQHHRGITHSFLGLPFEAALIVAGVYGWHWWRVRRGSRLKSPAPSGEARAKAEAPSRFPLGMTERKARAAATTKTNTGVSPLRGTMEPSRSGRDDRGLVDVGRDDRGLVDVGRESQAGEGSTFRKDQVVKPLTAAPVRWGVLYGLALLALLSHLLLDYTNSYGLRPFFPFNDRWYAASIMFLFDPVMFALLLGALTAPWLFGLVGSEVGVKKQPFRARGWAIAALIGVAGWWGLREVEHGQAMKMAMAQSMEAPVESAGPVAGPEVTDAGQSNASSNLSRDSSQGGVSPAQSLAQPIPVYLPVQRALASPEMLSPFRWSAVMDFGPVYQLAEVDTRDETLTLGQTTYPKPGRSPAVLEAEESKLGRVYMDWSPMPIVEVLRPDSALAGAASGEVDKVVTFRDPRFMGGGGRDAAHPPLEGTVALDARGRVVEETLGGRVER